MNYWDIKKIYKFRNTNRASIKMEKGFEIQKVQMESSVVGQKRNSPGKKLTPKTIKTLSPQLLTEVALTPHSDQS